MDVILAHVKEVVDCFPYIRMEVGNQEPTPAFRLSVELWWPRSQAHSDFATAHIFQGLADYHIAYHFALFDDFDAGYKKMNEIL